MNYLVNMPLKTSVSDTAGNTWTNTNCTFTTNDGYECMKVVKDAYVTCNNALSVLSYTNEYIISCWYWSASYEAYSVLLGNSTNSFQDALLSGCESYNKIGARIVNAYGYTIVDTEMSPLSKWVNVCLSGNSTGVRLFVDGKLKATITARDYRLDKGFACIRKGHISGYNGNNDIYIRDLRIATGRSFISDFNPMSMWAYTLYADSSNNVYGVVNSTFSLLSSSWSTEGDSSKIGFFTSTNRAVATVQNLTTINPFSILSYSDIPGPTTYSVKAVPYDKLFIPKALISIQSLDGIDIMTPVYNSTGNAVIRFIITKDLITYYTYNFTTESWDVIDHTSLTTVKASGILASQLSTISRAKWDLMTTGAGLAIGYLLAQESTTETNYIDSLAIQVDMKGSWDKAIHGTDYTYGYPQNNLLRVKLLTTGDYKINYCEPVTGV